MLFGLFGKKKQTIPENKQEEDIGKEVISCCYYEKVGKESAIIALMNGDDDVIYAGNGYFDGGYISAIHGDVFPCGERFSFTPLKVAEQGQICE